MGAFAQYRQQYEPEFQSRDIRLFRDQLALDDGQTMIVETLITDYNDAFEPAAEEAREISQEAMRELFQSFMGGMDRQVIGETFQAVQEKVRQLEQDAGGEIDEETRRKLMQESFEKLGQDMQAQRAANGGVAASREILGEMFDVTRQFSAKRAELRAAVVDGTKAVLTPEQAARWDAFERFVRRERAMSNGALSGESTNLIFIVDEAALPQESVDSLRSTLDAYELDLDQKLRDRDTYLADSETRLMKALVDGNNSAAEQVVKRQVELRRNVRDCNENFRTQIVSALPADQGARFNAAVNEASYRRIYQPSGTQRAIEAALEMNLEESTRALVQELQASYLTAIGAANDRIAVRTRSTEPDEQVTQATQFFAMIDGTANPTEMFTRNRGGRGFGPGSNDEELGKLYDAKTEINDSYRERLEGLLTPEQVEELPARGGRGGRGGQAGGPGQGGFGNFSGAISDLPERMQERAKEFDKNKDGTLDETEREEMFQSFRQGGGGGRGGRGGQGGGETPDA